MTQSNVLSASIEHLRPGAKYIHVGNHIEEWFGPGVEPLEVELSTAQPAGEALASNWEAKAVAARDLQAELAADALLQLDIAIMSEIRALDAGAFDLPLLTALGAGRPAAEIAAEERVRISARLSSIGAKEARRRMLIKPM